MWRGRPRPRSAGAKTLEREMGTWAPPGSALRSSHFGNPSHNNSPSPVAPAPPAHKLFKSVFDFQKKAEPQKAPALLVQSFAHSYKEFPMSTGDPNRKRKGKDNDNDKRKGEGDSKGRNKGKGKGKDKANTKGNQRKPSHPAPRKNTKITGERSEAGFLYKAAYLEFGIAKPWGDSLRYDFILDNGGRLHRIQVKCTEAIRAGAYETRATCKGRAPYTKKDIDFIAAHVVPLDIWYIIPVEVCTPAPMLRFYPHRKAKKMRLEQYREAWHLLQSPEAGKIEIKASADETVDTLVILSAAKDLCSLPSQTNGKKNHRTKPVRLPKSQAPWPIPPLRILATRKGKHIFPDPPS